MWAGTQACDVSVDGSDVRVYDVRVYASEVGGGAQETGRVYLIRDGLGWKLGTQVSVMGRMAVHSQIHCT